MADKRTTPETPEGGRRRKRAVPTIDLTATEVPSTPSESMPAGKPQGDAPPQESQPEAQASEADTQQGDLQHPMNIRGYVVPLAAGLAGGVFVAGVLGALWFAGLIPSASRNAADLRAQITALQRQVRELQNRPVLGADNKAFDTLHRRVDAIENEIAKLPRSDVTDQLATANNAMKSLGIALAALSHRSDEIAAAAAQAQAHADAAEKAVTVLRTSLQNAAKSNARAVAPAALAAIQQRVAVLEQSLKSVRANIATMSKSDKPARLALVAASLRVAANSGAPYAVELAQAKTLGADAEVLAPLQAFATTGLPGKAALARELKDLVPAMRKALGNQAPTRGFLDRLEASAGKLVRVRPVGASAGGKTPEVLARIELAAAKTDIGGALADLAKLPDKARAPAQDWIAKAMARQAALNAAGRFAAETVRALAKP